MHAFSLPRSVLLGVALALAPATALAGTPSASPSPAADASGAHANAALVRAAFDAWRDGQGSVFDLLHPQVEWTVAGYSPVSGVYRGREQFMAEAVVPINARLATPIAPQVEHVLAEGDAVMVLWSGQARAQDGSTYRNRYAWHMQLRDGQVVRVVAFLDTWALDQLMR